MNVDVAQLDLSSNSFSLSDFIKEKGCEVSDITTISTKLLSGRTSDTYKKDDSLCEVVNDILGTKFIHAFRNEKHMEGQYLSDLVDLDGEIFFVRDDGKFIHFVCSEWGSVSLI